MSGAISRHIRRWVRTIPADDLEFYALHLPKEPWKRLADLVHFNPKTVCTNDISCYLLKVKFNGTGVEFHLLKGKATWVLFLMFLKYFFHFL